MMRQYELVERVQRYKPDANEILLNKAYVYAMRKHGSQVRASGDPYFSHPLEVAAILTDMHLDESTIAVALLHDTIEDTSATRDEIDRFFGPDIGKLVEGLTKLKKLDLVSKKAVQAENLRKLFIAISEDVRVLLVKLADRLHNMRTLDSIREDKRRRIAQETMDIYAPLAGRMGMQDVREELEDLAFRYISPQAWQTVQARLADLLKRNVGLLAIIEQELTALFASHNISAMVKSRQKKTWSVFRKMETKDLSFEQLSDIFGFRVIVDDVSDCYRVLGIVHTTWSIVPGRFKDYISIPKQNDYRSLHTTIVGPSRQRVELQIRTCEMDEVAEYGVAAHAIYKDRGSLALTRKLSDETGAYMWLKRTVQALSEGDSPEEFLENTKLELFQDQVFCFTPKGRLIALPRGATSVDFAYAVHTSIGDSCIGVKINGRVVPLLNRLRNGDEVEIIRSNEQVPPAAWETMVITGKARLAIRRANRLAIRRQYSGVGQRILERIFDRSGKKFSIEDLQSVLFRLGRNHYEDVLTAVGRGELSSSDVFKAVYPGYQDVRITHKTQIQSGKEEWFNIQNAVGMLFRIPKRKEKIKGALKEQKSLVLPIHGIRNDISVYFAPEGAVPGDQIVGIIKPERGIIIYPVQSPALATYDNQPEVWIDVRWDIDARMEDRFPAKINVIGINSPGTLAEITHIIAENDANIQSLSMIRIAPDFSEMIIDIEVWDLKYLIRIISQLKATEMVSHAYRVSA